MKRGYETLQSHSGNLKGDDESRALTVLSSVPSSTDDGDPKCLEEWMEILATSRHFSPTQRLPKVTESNPKPRTDHKADSEGADGGLGKEGEVTTKCGNLVVTSKAPPTDRNPKPRTARVQRPRTQKYQD